MNSKQTPVTSYQRVQNARSGKRPNGAAYIAHMIFRVLLCLQLRKLNGLFRYACSEPDQVDIWNQG